MLPNLAEDEAMGGSLVPGNQQHLGLFRQSGSTLGAAIPQIPQGHSPGYGLDQGQGGAAIIVIPWRQDNIEHQAINVAQQMELEAKEPPFTALLKVCPFIAQQPHPSMADRLAKWNTFAVNQIQVGGLTRMGTSRTHRGVDAAGVSDGAQPSSSETRTAPSFRSRQSVCRHSLPAAPGPRGHGREHVASRKLLEQRLR